MKAAIFGLLMTGLSACIPYYKNVPVEEASANEPNNEINEPNKEIETVDLETTEIKVEETKETYNRPSPVENPEPDGKTGQNTKVVEPLEVAKVDSKPANSLLVSANKEINAGNYAKAEVLLQRALRINPREPKLWYKMAQVKYARADYRQSAAMAMRSNTMTSNPSLKKQNWRIVANSREKLGDLAGAEQARKYAAQ